MSPLHDLNPARIEYIAAKLTSHKGSGSQHVGEAVECYFRDLKSETIFCTSFPLDELV